VGFEVRLNVETQADLSAVRRMLNAGHLTCYTESCLRGEIPLVVTHALNGLVLDDAP
jgi:hypothetical protein